MIYLDWNATTPPAPEVLDAQRAAAAAAWANPASVHGAGRQARAAVERARQAVADLSNTDLRDVVVTSGGTEANNLALSLLLGVSGPRALFTSRLEHPSVTRTAEALVARGVHVVWVEPEPTGHIDPTTLLAQVDAHEGMFRMVSLQAVNHELGTIQPIAELRGPLAERRVLLHCDAVQAAGRLEPSSFRGADLISLAGHKLRGPKGIGALACRPGLELVPLLRGGAQERGLRPGTQDPMACAGFAVACARALDSPARWAALAPLRDELEAQLLELAGPGALQLNSVAPRAPHLSNLSFVGWSGPELCAALDLEGVAVSSGAACSAGTAEPSEVVRAVHGASRAAGAVRISLGELSTRDDVEQTLAAFSRVLRRCARSSA
jgi:cysteine desulfurase